MYCKLCGRHLYETITFATLFKWNYSMHLDCEAAYHPLDEFVVVPLLGQLGHYDYLFPIGYPDSDLNFLFTKYMGRKWAELLKVPNWSMLILLDDIVDTSDLSLVIQLGSGMVILLSLFDEQILPPKG